MLPKRDFNFKIFFKTFKRKKIDFDFKTNYTYKYENFMNKNIFYPITILKIL